MTTPSLPDTQERYPSEETLRDWIYPPKTNQRAPYSEVVRQACDWQREQDATTAAIHSQYPIENDYDRGYAQGRRDAAGAIRTPPQPGAAQ